MEEALQKKMTIKEENVMYVQHNRGRGHGCGGRGFGRNGGCVRGNNNEDRGQMSLQYWHGKGHDRGKGGHSNHPNVECFNCGKYGHYAKDCYVEKKGEENENLVEEFERKDEKILIMANKDVTLDNDMVWYLDIGARNHMCGHKNLFVDIQEIKDYSQRPGKICFPKRTKKKVLWRTFIMYLK